MPSMIDEVRATGSRVLRNPYNIIEEASQVVEEALAGPAVVAALDVTVEGGAAVGGAAAGATVGIVLLIVLIILIFVFALMSIFRDQVAGIRFVGGPLASVIDSVDGVLVGPAHFVEDKFREVAIATLAHIRTIIWVLIGVSGVPGLRQIQALISLAFGPLAKIINSIETHVIHIDTVVTTTQAHLGAYAHGLWSRIQAIEDWVSATSRTIADLQFTINWMRQNITQLWNWSHQFFNWIQALQAAVGSLFFIVTGLQQQVNMLQREVQRLQKEIDDMGDIVAPAGEAVAIMTLLAPLVAVGPPGIDTLTKLAEDPCHCFRLPGSIGFFLEAIVSDLALTEGL